MFYSKSIAEIFEEFKTSPCGISREEAAQRLRKYGLNSIDESKEISIFFIILNQFISPLIYILLIAAIFTALINHYVDMIVILAAVLINAVVGFIQEYKAEKSIAALKKLSSQRANVIRQCHEEKIDSFMLVPGDLITLSVGNKVPADVRIIETKELSVDESMFTGETVPVEKHSDLITVENVQLADQLNMAFMGSVITNGRGKGVVVAVGNNTELGKITKDVQQTQKENTPLQKKLSKLSDFLGIASLGLALFVFILGLLKGNSVSEMLLFSISMAVAIIPEGLPVVVTITMAIGLKRMADKNAVIRKLVAVETLGSCNYICTDKTGTITENRMLVKEAFANGKNYMFTGSGYEPKGEILINETKVQNDKDLYDLLLCSILCNFSELYKENNEWMIDGDPTEGALIVAAQKYGLTTENIQYEYKLVDVLEFTSKRQYMASLYQKNNHYLIFIKGAPEKMLNFSNNAENQFLHDNYLKMAEKGLRVLGFGVKKIDADSINGINLEYESNNNVRFLGFIGIIDPPRASVVCDLAKTRKAGIRTVMITGDHKVTALSIAKQIGILREGDLIMSGEDIDNNDEEFLDDNVESISVYARVSAHHKLKIVSALQNKKHIVAVTGDGVNDAPALKKSNIGVAMGKSGTDVAREAADMILRDDNYSSIYEAVKIGRIIYDNIQKVIYFLLVSGVGISIIIIFCLVLDLPLPLLATQVLWINLVTNGLQDMALAYEPGEENIGEKSPRPSNENIINNFLFKRIILAGIVTGIGSFLFYLYVLSEGHNLIYARTVAFNTIVFFQFFHVLNSRSFDKSIFKTPVFSNPFLLISIIVALSAQISAFIFEPFHFILKTTDLDLVTWVQIILTAITIVIVMEIDKFIRFIKHGC